ncbi:DUF1566 domain-containing protein [Stutzerimonas stutzeri]|nr:DUF1566 domain-containing protein [Stutzerimonas stutzeri]
MSSGSGIDWNTIPAGTFIEGGYYAGGLINIDGLVFALILAPTEGVIVNARYRHTSGGPATSRYDGKANTEALLADPTGIYDAALYCAGLVVSGYDDWYLPAMDELEICYRHLNSSGVHNQVNVWGSNPYSVPPGSNYTTYDPPATTSPLFMTGGVEILSGNTWTSTSFDFSQAWCPNLTNGQLQRSNKTDGRPVRPIRRVPVGS